MQLWSSTREDVCRELLRVGPGGKVWIEYGNGRRYDKLRAAEAADLAHSAARIHLLKIKVRKLAGAVEITREDS